MIESIAVILSTYNNPDFLRLVLDGYAKQTDKHFSIYIADDGSTTETRKLIEQLNKTFPVPIQHIWHEDSGFRKARVHNLALKEVHEPYVILTDGDCIPLPHMIATHRRLAQANTLISGSRILLSQAWTEQLCIQQPTLKNSMLFWIQQRLQTNINRLLPLMMPAHLSSPHKKLSGIHGCHLACFTADLLRINGFDESFEGWGREDSDLVARLLHSGVERRNLRGTPVLHLWHKENSRSNLDDNNDLLNACLNEKRQQALIGIRELAHSPEVKETCQSH